MRRSILRRTVLLVLATLLISAFLTAAGYFVLAQSVFARMSAAELAPTADGLAQMAADVRAGRAPAAMLLHLAESAPDYWGARAVVCDAEGAEALGMYPTDDAANRAFLERLAPSVRKVLEGKDTVIVRNPLGAGGELLVVGRPVLEDGETVGAVLLVKSMAVVRAAMGGLNRTLLLSMTAAFLLMLLPAYFASRRLVLPVRRMQAAADAMARGDFSVRADETARGELGALAASLNRLSQELSRTIGELTQERNRLALVLDGLAEGIVAVDADGCVTRTNPSVRALAGAGGNAPTLPADAALPAETVADDVDRIPGLRADLAATVRDGRPLVREVPLGERVLRVATTPLLDAAGGIAGAVALVRDTTEAARLEKARRDYVSNVSHEFRTPVSSIRGLLEPLRDGLVPEEADRARYYSFLLRETERLTRLIDDLLELSRLQGRTAAFEARPVRLPRLYDEIRERFRRRLEERSARLEVAPLPDDAPPAFGNPDRIEQVLVALVDNALRFSPEGGRILLRTTLEADRYRVRVEDEGPGIPPEALPHVFDRFFKAEGQRDGEGSGLGLAIAREVLRSMGQEIEARSEPGRGAAFTFTLARADAAPTEGGNA